MNWEAVAKPSIRWTVTKAVFHESQLQSQNKSITGKGSTLSKLIYHWLLILLSNNKTTSILFFFSLVPLSFCWGSPLHHSWLIKKKKRLYFHIKDKKICVPVLPFSVREMNLTTVFQMTSQHGVLPWVNVFLWGQEIYSLFNACSLHFLFYPM